MIFTTEARRTQREAIIRGNHLVIARSIEPDESDVAISGADERKT